MTNWRVEKETGDMLYESPGMIGKIKLLGKGTSESPCEFAWSIAYAPLHLKEVTRYE